MDRPVNNIGPCSLNNGSNKECLSVTRGAQAGLFVVLVPLIGLSPWRGIVLRPSSLVVEYSIIGDHSMSHCPDISPQLTLDIDSQECLW